MYKESLLFKTKQTHHLQFAIYDLSLARGFTRGNINDGRAVKLD